MNIKLRGVSLLILSFFVLALSSGCNNNEPDDPVEGCTDPSSINYNPDATVDDGSCQTAGAGVGTDTITSNITTPTTLTDDPNAAVDYFICGSISIQSSLVIDPGVVIQMCAGASITISASGSIAATGSPTAPITIEGENNTPGYWNYILVNSNNSANSMQHVNISDGGGSSFYLNGMIYLENASGGTQMEFQNCTFDNSAGYGIYSASGSRLPNFQNNTFSNNVNAGLLLPFNRLDQLDAASTYDNNNGENYVESIDVDVATDMTIQDLGTPILVQNAPTINADVTLNAGVHFLMDAGSRIAVSSSGSLSSNGSQQNIVTIEGAVATAGHWDYILVESNNPLNNFTHTLIRHGGGSSFYFNSMIYVEGGGTLGLENVTLSNSSGYGIYVDIGASLSSFSDNLLTANGSYPIRIPSADIASVDAASDYSGNTEDYILVGDTDIGQNGTVVPTNVPYLLEGSITITSDLVLSPGVNLRMASNAQLSVDPSGSLNAVGTVSNPISIEGEVASVGYWGTLLIESNNPLNNFEYVNISHGGGSSFYFNATIYIEGGSNGSLRFYDSSLSDSYGYGIYVDGSASLDPNTPAAAIAANTFSNNATGSAFSCTVANCDVFFQ